MGVHYRICATPHRFSTAVPSDIPAIEPAKDWQPEIACLFWLFREKRFVANHALHSQQKRGARLRLGDVPLHP
jgi:hypothetical protein